jgi:hypothetical protein
MRNYQPRRSSSSFLVEGEARQHDIESENLLNLQTKEERGPPVSSLRPGEDLSRQA